MKRESQILAAFVFAAVCSMFVSISYGHERHNAMVSIYEIGADYVDDWGVGSGIVVHKNKDNSCWVMTAAHVVNELGDIQSKKPLPESSKVMIVKFSDGTTRKMTFVSRALKQDLAIYLCAVCPKGVEPVPIAEKDVVPGDSLYLQAQTHRSSKESSYAFKANPLTTPFEVVGNGVCWTGESGTALLNEDQELVGILTGGWRYLNRHLKGTFKTNPKNSGNRAYCIYPITATSSPIGLKYYLKTVTKEQLDSAKALANPAKASAEKPARLVEYTGTQKLDDNSKRIIMLSASWCQPCQVLKSKMPGILGELGKRGVVEVLYVDCEKYPNMKRRFGPSVFPTLVLKENNVEKGRLIGGSIEGLQSWMASR